jgi:hypothetical protein
MTYTIIVDRCADYPVALVCKTMGLSTSRSTRGEPIPGRRNVDRHHVRDTASWHSYGSPRVHAELRLGDRELRCGQNRVERLMRQTGFSCG